MAPCILIKGPLFQKNQFFLPKLFQKSSFRPTNAYIDRNHGFIPENAIKIGLSFIFLWKNCPFLVKNCLFWWKSAISVNNEKSRSRSPFWNFWPKICVELLYVVLQKFDAGIFLILTFRRFFGPKSRKIAIFGYFCHFSQLSG